MITGQRSARDTMTKFIDMIFYRHEEIKGAVKNVRLMKNCFSGHTGGNNSGHSFVSDPTALQGIANAEEIKSVSLSDGMIVMYPERCIRVVIEAYKKMDTLEANVTRSRYCLQRKSTETCEKYGISKDTYSKIINNSRTLGKLIAVQLGLIKVV